MDDHRHIFKELYDAHSDAIFRHLYYRLSDRERALDLTQEVFSRLWQYLSAGKAIEHPKAFLYRSAHNAFVNEIRTDKRTLSLERLSEAGLEVAYDESDQEELALQKEMVVRVRELPEASRTSMVMRYVDGLGVKEIAGILGESENTISARIARGRKKLRELYGHT